jgi:putative transcriptional regulator
VYTLTLKLCAKNREELIMDVSYNKLFKLLIDKEMRKTEFAKAVGISANTLAKLSRNDTVSMEVIIKICRYLNCTVDDIMEILP